MTGPDQRSALRADGAAKPAPERRSGASNAVRRVVHYLSRHLLTRGDGARGLERAIRQPACLSGASARGQIDTVQLLEYMLESCAMSSVRSSTLRISMLAVRTPDRFSVIDVRARNAPIAGGYDTTTLARSRDDAARARHC